MTVLLIAAGIIIAGVIGFFIGRSSSGGDSEQLKVDYEQRLQQSEQELEHYRQQVTDHFKGTADLVEQMNENYRSVYLHLAKGAQELTQGQAEMHVNPSTLAPVVTADALPSSDGTSEPVIVEDEQKDDKGKEEDCAESARKAGL